MLKVPFPRSDSGLLAYSQNFLNLITATPTAFGLVASDATSYGTVHLAYQTALAACEPDSRSKPAVITKNAARTSLKNAFTLLANKVYSSAAVTDSQKTQLGIPPRVAPSPIPQPTTSPTIKVVSVEGWTAKVKLSQAGSEHRGKPAGVSGASVFSFVGATPPTDIAQWKFEANTGRSNITLVFPNTLEAGTKFFLTAFWFNGRKQSGPACEPVSANLPGGGVALTA